MTPLAPPHFTRPVDDELFAEQVDTAMLRLYAGDHENAPLTCACARIEKGYVVKRAGCPRCIDGTLRS